MATAETRGKAEKTKDVRAKILSGFMRVILIILVLIACAIIIVNVIERGYDDINSYRDQQVTAEGVITAHYKWLDALNASILNDVEFEGGLDPDACSLGKWLNGTGPQLLNDSVMDQALEEIITPHKEIHAAASELITQSQTDPDGAFERYTNEVKPKVQKIGEGLSTISERYREIAAGKADGMHGLVLVCIFICIGVGVVDIFLAIEMGTRLARKISRPIVNVAEWSEALSSGVDNLPPMDGYGSEANGISEIQRMILAFQEMANGIRRNVDVIQRVAEGDLTAYVDIRSSGDSLGRNLYHLVQNNDMMFANLLRVADSVAGNSENIAHASQALAESSTNQAGAVEALSETVDKADTLAVANAQKAGVASDTSELIRQKMADGNDKMRSLVAAVDEIRKASDQVSGVMKAIDDIAFQTNILALNAAVEAARAGAAGKGFAVVAEEVRNLALKSQEAAKQSNDLIVNTIGKAKEGSRISQDTFVTFESITQSANQITDVVKEIAGASVSQQKYMNEINKQIQRISDTVSGNAANSEETAAATQEMRSNAELIRQEMKRFNLRKRVEGKPYIPAEKANDTEFVRQAYENYLKKQQGLQNVGR